MSNSDHGDGGVGYKKPPAKNQFKPGQSGNPSGRPKGAKNLWTMVREESESEILINEYGQKRRVSKMRAGLIQMNNKSAAGDLKAIQMALNLHRDLETRESEDTLTERPLQEDDHLVMHSIVQRIVEDYPQFLKSEKSKKPTNPKSRKKK